MGGGYIGIEFASIYRQFGAQVTLFEASTRILGREDDEAAAVAEAILTGDGIEIIKGAHVSEVRDGEQRRDRRSTRRAGAGTPWTSMPSWPPPGARRPPASLGLEAAGVRTTARGRGRGRRVPAHEPAAHLRAGRRARRAAAHLPVPR